MKIFLFSLAVILSVALNVVAQDSWDAYQPRTFKDLVTISERSQKDPDVVLRNPKNEPVLMLSYNAYQSKVIAIYSGESRKIPVERMELIKNWLTTFSKPKEFADMFEDEYLFTENKIEYWLPVQKQVASYFPKELKKGDTVTLYVAWLGGLYKPNGFVNVFIVNEFDKDE